MIKCQQYIIYGCDGKRIDKFLHLIIREEKNKYLHMRPHKWEYVTNKFNFKLLINYILESIVALFVVQYPRINKK